MKRCRKKDDTRQPIISDQEWAKIKACTKAAGDMVTGRILKDAQVSQLLQRTDPRPIGLDFTKLQNKLLGQLLFTKERYINSEMAEIVISFASKANDLDFFVRLGRVLSAKPIRSDDRLTSLLVREWTRRGPNKLRSIYPNLSAKPSDYTPLCMFSIVALREYCRIKLNNANLSDWAIDKRRERLGLPRASRTSVRNVKKTVSGWRYVPKTKKQ